MSASLSRQRRWTSPQPGDTLASVAARELPGVPAADAMKQLGSWNLHLVIRPLVGFAPGTLLGSDVVYLEPPLAEGVSDAGPRITKALLAAGHDGRAELVVEVTYANGATSRVRLDEEAAEPVLAAAGVSRIEDLIGRPWDILAAALRPETGSA